MACIGFISFFLYTFQDKKLDASQAAFNKDNEVVDDEEAFKIKDILNIIKIKVGGI